MYLSPSSTYFIVSKYPGCPGSGGRLAKARELIGGDGGGAHAIKLAMMPMIAKANIVRMRPGPGMIV